VGWWETFARRSSDKPRPRERLIQPGSAELWRCFESPNRKGICSRDILAERKRVPSSTLTPHSDCRAVLQECGRMSALWSSVRVRENLVSPDAPGFCLRRQSRRQHQNVVAAKTTLPADKQDPSSGGRRLRGGQRASGPWGCGGIAGIQWRECHPFPSPTNGSPQRDPSQIRTPRRTAQLPPSSRRLISCHLQKLSDRPASVERQFASATLRPALCHGA
jgi:hypothetical protein